MHRLMKRIDDWEWLWAVRCFGRRIGLVARHRPLLTCPFCKGRGGSSDYYGEWCECPDCFHFWHALENHRWEWFVGRVPVWTWVRAKVCIYFGHWECIRLRDLFRCKLGFHRWFNQDDMEPGLRICGTCYEAKNVNDAKWKPGDSLDE
jgi:hypothetical protein